MRLASWSARRVLGIAAVLSLSAMVLVAGGSAARTPQSAGPDGLEAIFGGEIGASFYTPLGLSTEPAEVMVQLAGETIAQVQAKVPDRKLSKAEKTSIRANLKSEQNAIKPAIAALSGQVTADYQAAYNGIRVTIARDKIADLKQLPNVIGVRAIQKHERTNATSVPYIGTPAAWNGATGYRGEGIKIAIIDTGIDYTHANFGGPGTAAAFDAADATDTAPANPAHFGPGAPKVKGGIDLVGDDYNASAAAGSPALTPHPDPNPLDCNGHGSHVAGTAAGFGVKSDGSTYSGSYDPTTHASNSFRIGPGVAPKADLYAVRVFGCAGSTDVTVDAIEWAVDNDMDVINMSLGSVFGDAEDPSAVAAANAAKAGIIVVASAGNSGAAQYITGSPATGTGVISVAANDSNVNFPGYNVVLTGGGAGPSFTVINANGHVGGAGTYTIKRITDNPLTPLVNEALGCNVADYTWDGVSVAGKMALVLRGVCARVGKAIRGQQAGASSVAMINTDSGYPPFEGRITRHPDTGEDFIVTIPFLGIRGCLGAAACPGDTDHPDRFVASDGATATITDTTIPNTNFTGFATFTSGGPRTGDSFLKPDITAPGVSINSTGIASGNEGALNSGTSMAAPHVAGVAALVAQAHPGWKKATDLAAAIVNTANPSAIGGTSPYRTSRGGTGLVQPLPATQTNVVALGKDGFALDFGFDELKDNFSKSVQLKVRNNGSAPATFSVGTANPNPAATVRPHTVTPSVTTVTVSPGSLADISVQLDVPAATVGNSVGTTANPPAFREIAGLVVLTPTGGSNNGVTLRIPYYLVPRALAQLEVKVKDKHLKSSSPTTTATVQNKPDAAIAGDADFYAWGLEDGPDGGKDLSKSSADVRALGVQAFPCPFPAQFCPGGTNDRLIVFAVSTWDRWSNAATNEFDIFVDVDPQNGNGDDYVVVGVDAGAVLTGSFSGVMGSFVFSTRSGGASRVFNATAPTDSSTALLPILSPQLCRTGEPCLNKGTNPRFTYTAVGFDLLTGGVDTVKGEAKFNSWTPAISNGAFLTVPPGGTATTPITIDPAEWALTPAKGIMVVTTENKSGKDEAELIEMKLR